MNTCSILKGIAGEAIVENILLRNYNKNMILKNLIIDGNQVDLIVITKAGIFCLEVKNFSGCINGEKNKKIWYVKYGDRTRTMYNPILQNQKHVSLIKNKIKKVPVFNLVVFTGTAKVNVKDNKIVNMYKLINVMNSKPQFFTTNVRMKEIRDTLKVYEGLSGMEQYKQISEYSFNKGEY